MSKKHVLPVQNFTKQNVLSNCSKGYSLDELFNIPLKNDSNNWSVPWSDLMMVMFVLFTVLFVYAINNPEIKKVFEQVTYGGSNRLSYQTQSASLSKGQYSDTTSINKELNALYQELKTEIKSFSSQDVSLYLKKDKAVIIRLHGPRIFNPGQASLNPGSVPILLAIANILKMKSDLIEVIGHVQKNEQKKMPANWGLSSQRAGNVANFFIQEAGLDPKRFTIIAQAAHAPLVPEFENQKNELNRRVDIRVLNSRQIQNQG